MSKSEWVENIASRFYMKVHYSDEASRGVYMEGYRVTSKLKKDSLYLCCMITTF